MSGSVKVDGNMYVLISEAGLVLNSWSCNSSLCSNLVDKGSLFWGGPLFFL